MEKNELLEMAKNLIVITEPAGRLATAVKQASRVLGCQRCCLILLVGQNDLIIAQGTPETDHGLGQKITDQYGRKFLFGVLEQNLQVIVANAKTDRRTQYMKDMIRDYQIISVLYLPLFHQRKPLGLLVFDAISEEEKHKFFIKENISKINAIAELVAAAVAREGIDKQRKEEMLRQEKIIMLGQQTASLMHSLKGLFVTIGLATKRIAVFTKEKQELKEFTDYALITSNSIKKIEEILDQSLRFVGFSEKNLKKDHYDINDFVVNVLKKFHDIHHEKIAELRLKIRFIPDNRIKPSLITFDWEVLEICFIDILNNAFEALSENSDYCDKKILVKIKLQADKTVSIIIANNKRIESSQANEVFSPFYTTKKHGTGLGLANARAFVQAHGGKITLWPEPWAQFKIILPLG